MKTINFLKTELSIFYATALPAGHGHKEITVELCHDGNYRKFSAITSNMPDYDDAQDLDGGEKHEALFNIISGQIEEQVEEWIAVIENAK